MPFLTKTTNKIQATPTGADFNNPSPVLKDILHIVTPAEEISKIIVLPFQYDIGIYSLEVYVNGHFKRSIQTIDGTQYGDYTENTNFSVTFETGVILTGYQVRFRVTANSYDYSSRNNNNIEQLSRTIYGRESSEMLRGTAVGYGVTEVNALAYGSAYDDVTIQAAINGIGSDERTLIIPIGTWSIDSDITVPENINLKIVKGAILTITTGITLTINGSFEAGLYQVFDCVGTGTVYNLKLVYPEWFGALGDNVNDDSDAFNASNDALPTSGGVIQLESRTYYLITKMTVTKPISILGKGPNKTFIRSAKRQAPNGNYSSSTAIYANGIDGLRISGITFDGDVTTFVNVDADDSWMQSPIEIVSSSNIIIEDCNFTKWFSGLPATIADATYKVGAIFIYTCEHIIIDNVEHISTISSPSYGDCLMAIDVVDICVEGLTQTFATNNATPINIWGEHTQGVIIKDFNIENNAGSAINLGGLGDFQILGGRITSGKGIDLSNESMWSQYLTHPNMYNVLIHGTSFVDCADSFIVIGDMRSGQAVSSHDIIVSGVTVRATTGFQPKYIVVGNADHALINGNSLNGGGVQVSYCRETTIIGNILNGRYYSGAGQENGIKIWTRSDHAEEFDILIKENTIMNWEDGPIVVNTFFDSNYTNVSIINNDFIQRIAPTSGQYITIVNPLYALNVLTIIGNRVNNLDYVPMIGTDIEMYYTTLNLGTGQSYVGSFTRDIATASGNQTISGVGFRPRMIFFHVAQDDGNVASWGFCDSAASGSTFNKDTVLAGTFGYNASLIKVVKGAADTYTGVLSTFNDDGFVISWTKAGSPTGTITCSYIAIK